MKKLLCLTLVLLMAGCAVVNKQQLPPLPPIPTPMLQSRERLTLLPSPTTSIQTGLSNLIVTQGDNVTLSVVVSNAAFYHWQIPNLPLFVGTNTYTITNIQSINQGVVTVSVADSTEVVQSGKTNKISGVYSSAYISVGTTNILADCIPACGQSATLTWCPSESTNPIVSYQIYYGTGQTTNWIPSIYDTNMPCGPVISVGTNWLRSYTQSITVGNTNIGVVTNLTPGVTYYFASKVMDLYSNQSDFSNEARWTAPYRRITNSFPVGLTLISPQLIQLSAKVCPDSLLTIQAKQTLMQTNWYNVATNLAPDIYGNFFYNHVATNTMKFFRLKLQ